MASRLLYPITALCCLSTLAGCSKSSDFETTGSDSYRITEIRDIFTGGSKHAKMDAYSEGLYLCKNAGDNFSVTAEKEYQSFLTATDVLEITCDGEKLASQTKSQTLAEIVQKGPPPRFEAIKSSAEMGIPSAQAMLGIYYRDGLGTPKDPTQAAKWFLAASEQGYDEAQFLLGALYQRGEGVPQDYSQATKWYQAAAKQGNPRAKEALNEIYSGSPK